jgi:hypothetical protein
MTFLSPLPPPPPPPPPHVHLHIAAFWVKNISSKKVTLINPLHVSYLHLYMCVVTKWTKSSTTLANYM